MTGMNLTKTTLTILMLLCNITMFAQQLTIKGKVIDSISKQPVDAAIIIQDASTLKTIKSTLANEMGEFNFFTMQPGKYKISIGAMAYANKSIIVNKLDTGTLDLGTILLKATATNLKQVEIVANRPLIQSLDDKVVYNVENDPSAKASNAIDLLRKTPFVTVDGNDNIQLNGQSNFKVLLNGKETALFALNLKDALKSFPGSLVKKVEIITSPSAKYDAEGIGGIINIITDKKIAGSNGSISSYASTLSQYQGSANFNIRTGKIGITSFANTSGSFSNIKSKNINDTRTIGASPYLQRTLNGDRLSRNLGSSGALEVSYDIDSVNSLSAYGNLGKGSRESTLNQSILTKLPNQVFTNGNLNILTEGETPSFGYGLDYIRKGKKNREEEFTIRLNGQLSKNRSLTNSFQADALTNLDLINNNREKNAEYTIQTDYIKPITTTRKFEIGLKVIARKAVSDYESLFRTNVTNPFTPNPGNSNNFEYLQQVYSSYISYQFKLGEYAFRTGLRAEHTEVDGDFITTGTPVEQSYTNLIPNVQVTHKWNDKFSSVLSYNVRLQRPSITNLNPFIYNTDPLNITFGNPELTAQTFHFVNLQTRFIKGNTFAGLTLYGSLSNNMISQYALFNPTTGVTSNTSGNIGKEQQFSAIVNFNTRINKFSFGINGILRYNSVKSTIEQPLLQKGFSGSTFFNGNYKLSDWFTLSGSGGVMKQSYTVLGRGATFIPYQINVGYTLIKDKLTGAVNFNNFLKKSFDNKSYVENSSFYQENNSISPYRVTFFGLTYRFGSLKENVSRKKGVDNDDLLK